VAWWRSFWSRMYEATAPRAERLTVKPPYPSCQAKSRKSGNVVWIHSEDRFLTWRSMSAGERSVGKRASRCR
jgi:hypothetical protein